MDEAQRKAAQIEAMAASGNITRYLTLIEKCAATARVALSEAIEMSSEASKPILEVAPAGLRLNAGQAHGPSINAKLSATARMKMTAYHEAIRNLRISTERLEHLLDPDPDDVSKDD